MNQIRELTKREWGVIRKALDLLFRCKLGHLKGAFEEFAWETVDRLQQEKKTEKANLFFNIIREAGEDMERKLNMTIHGHFSVFWEMKDLDDPIRQLIIQADLRSCRYADNLEECPEYPWNCASPAIGSCPRGEMRKEK